MQRGKLRVDCLQRRLPWIGSTSYVHFMEWTQSRILIAYQATDHQKWASMQGSQKYQMSLILPAIASQKVLRLWAPVLQAACQTIMEGTLTTVHVIVSTKVLKSASYSVRAADAAAKILVPCKSWDDKRHFTTPDLSSAPMKKRSIPNALQDSSLYALQLNWSFQGLGCSKLRSCV